MHRPFVTAVAATSLSLMSRLITPRRPAAPPTFKSPVGPQADFRGPNRASKFVLTFCFLRSKRRRELNRSTRFIVPPAAPATRG